MAKKIQITERQAEQFNRMLASLTTIHKGYAKPEKLQQISEKEYGLHYEEVIEMCYENIQTEAEFGCKNVKPIIINP